MTGKERVPRNGFPVESAAVQHTAHTHKLHGCDVKAGAGAALGLTGRM
jgi:hypothetical protein